MLNVTSYAASTSSIESNGVHPDRVCSVCVSESMEKQVSSVHNALQQSEVTTWLRKRVFAAIFVKKRRKVVLSFKLFGRIQARST